MFSSASHLQPCSKKNEFSSFQPEVVIHKPKWRRLLWPVQVTALYDKVPTEISHHFAYNAKGETRVYRMWVNVLPVMHNKFNMAAETGSKNNLHFSSEIDAV